MQIEVNFLNEKGGGTGILSVAILHINWFSL